MAGQSLSWLALERGTPVKSREGEPIGVITDVIADREKDIFSGITIDAGPVASDRFLPASLIQEITDDEVRATISSAEAEKLQPFDA
jgi:uncharacterized protein YrrD